MCSVTINSCPGKEGPSIPPTRGSTKMGSSLQLTGRGLWKHHQPPGWAPYPTLNPPASHHGRRDSTSEVTFCISNYPRQHCPRAGRRSSLFSSRKRAFRVEDRCFSLLLFFFWNRQSPGVTCSWTWDWKQLRSNYM